MVRWNHQILEEFLAPGIAKFCTADIADLRAEHPQAPHWIANHLLNSVLRGRFSPDSKASVLNVLFRARTAFNAYHRARDLTAEFLSRGEPSNPASGVYFDALASWETTLLNMQLAHDVMRPLGGDTFEKGDGSGDERLWLLVNRIKHCGDDIARGVHTSDFTVPMWMTDDGLASSEVAARLTWKEVTQHVDALATLADELQDPPGMAEKQKAQIPS